MTSSKVQNLDDFLSRQINVTATYSF